MQNKRTFEGTYKINDGEEKDFSFDYTIDSQNEERINKLSQLLDSPWKLILQGGKNGVKGVRRFFTVVFLFMISNTILFFYAIKRLFTVDFEFNKLLFVFLVLILGLGVTIYAGYRVYNYVIIDTIRVIYENLRSFFMRVCSLIIDKSANLLSGKEKITDAELAKKLDVAKMINSEFKKIPKFLRKGIIMILNKIPFLGMLIDLKQDIENGNKTQATAKLHNKIDTFISENIFGNNNTKWVLLLLPANIIILFILIKFKIG